MDFTQVITRLPSLNCANGETTATAGEPDSLQTRQQFFRYIEILLELNLRVTILPAEPEFPDAHFVEDPAVVIPELAIITHPGAKSRQGEEISLAAELEKYRPLYRMQGGGHLDGGDVLLAGRQFFIGLTARTDQAGIDEFRQAVTPFGYQVSEVTVPAGLHLKSVVNYIGNNTLLLTATYHDLPVFAGYQRIVIPDSEAYAGNTLLINGTLITPEGYPQTLAKLQQIGMPIIEIDTSEFKKMDGSLTCLSLRF
ncbi:dimethylarginine dimethylaminohydrolase family protein [Tatumella saanichensis]|uniref:dimethylarginine dimethylaminohydrolase family protein n=1 Tax=Tatumella saanichensis TaxID=480813 RepID=UPI0004A275FE|nr:amidinotransferase [Tatumella saanichensis]